MPSKPTGTPSTGKHEEWLRVGRQLSFALYGASNRIIRLHRPFLEPLGLTYPQFLVMLALYEDAPRSVGDLGLVLGMETGTLTPLLKRLQTAGLVTRTRLGRRTSGSHRPHRGGPCPPRRGVLRARENRDGLPPLE